MNKKVFESIIKGRELLEESYNEDYYGYDISPFRPFTESDKIDVADLPNGSEPLIFKNDYLLMTIGGITYEETDLCVLEICVDNPGREPEDTTDNFTAYDLKAPFEKCLRIGKRISRLKSQDEVTHFCSMRGGSIIKVYESIIKGREKLKESSENDFQRFKRIVKEFESNKDWIEGSTECLKDLADEWEIGKSALDYLGVTPSSKINIFVNNVAEVCSDHGLSDEDGEFALQFVERSVTKEVELEAGEGEAQFLDGYETPFGKFVHECDDGGAYAVYYIVGTLNLDDANKFEGRNRKIIRESFDSNISGMNRKLDSGETVQQVLEYISEEFNNKNAVDALNFVMSNITSKEISVSQDNDNCIEFSTYISRESSKLLLDKFNNNINYDNGDVYLLDFKDEYSLDVFYIYVKNYKNLSCVYFGYEF